MAELVGVAVKALSVLTRSCILLCDMTIKAPLGISWQLQKVVGPLTTSLPLGLKVTQRLHAYTSTFWTFLFQPHTVVFDIDCDSQSSLGALFGRA